MNSTVTDTSRPPDSKALLFCFECGHESEVDGDWILEHRDDREHYRCPECGTTITARPTDEGGRASDSSGGRSYCAGD
ncbi:hypothetical protein [Haloterrigena salinisoli]|uniref:hypothetical protein n=1 Tax=Haloterrigena salinisoli TaxID=3132747 RepID=UPI0030D4D46D